MQFQHDSACDLQLTICCWWYDYAVEDVGTTTELKSVLKTNELRCARQWVGSTEAIGAAYSLTTNISTISLCNSAQMKSQDVFVGKFGFCIYKNRQAGRNSRLAHHKPVKTTQSLFKQIPKESLSVCHAIIPHSALIVQYSARQRACVWTTLKPSTAKSYVSASQQQTWCKAHNIVRN